MRIAFCGKGGSGKTTLCSLFTTWLESTGNPVIAIDGDINQHLGNALGFSDEELDGLSKIGVEQDLLRTYVKGQNEGIRQISDILETTPPGRGSQFFRFSDSDNEVLNRFSLVRDNLRFMAIGGHSLNDMATTCYHKFTAAMGIFLNHLIDGTGEYVVGDMVAGADPFASSGLVSRYDLIVLAVEPTRKSLEVYHQASNYLQKFNLRVKVVANKVVDEDDLAFIKQEVGEDYLGHLPFSSYIRKLDKGLRLTADEIPAEAVEVMSKIKELADNTERDWKRYLQIGLEYHKIASEAWAENWLGTDPMKQVDKEFAYDKVLS